MDAVELITPREGLEASHRAFVEEFRAKGERVVPWVADEPHDDFAAYVVKLKDGVNGIGLRPGMVPHSTFWLLTCDKDNVASARTILRNGGELDGEEFLPDEQRVVSRYWISLA